MLDDVINEMEEAEMASYSRLWIVKGDLERYRSKYELAILYYQRAELQAEGEADALSQSMALEGIARVYLDTIQPRHAQAYLKKSIQILEQKYLEGLAGEEKTEIEKQLRQLYVSMSENTINLGDAEEAQRWFDKSRQIQLGEVEADLEARLLLRTGRLGEMIRRLERRKRGRKDQGKRDNRPPNSHRETDLLLSFVYALTGRAKEAKDYASEAIMQGVKAKAPFVEACGWMRLGHATQLQEKYEQRLASTCYQTALEMMEEMNISRGKAEPYMGLSLLYGKKRTLDAAIKYAKLGLAETEKVDDRWLSSWLHLCEAVAYIYANHNQEALNVLDKCHEQFLLCGDSYGLTVTTLWQAFVSYRMEDETKFYPYVHHFLQLVEKEGYDELLQKPTLFGPVDVQQMSPMLLEAYHHRNQEQPFLHH
ncbi:MAG: hypothetical protein LRY73_05915 [Bacillus sp. (in: Bacteria)]|nr:hypothetical protein [Bacillus sp. (in: firmicutes)]